ncbi:Adenylate/guanylate cyclase domain-containing protein [Balamuthia mandrillaris]
MSWVVCVLAGLSALLTWLESNPLLVVGLRQVVLAGVACYQAFELWNRASSPQQKYTEGSSSQDGVEAKWRNLSLMVAVGGAFAFLFYSYRLLFFLVPEVDETATQHWPFWWELLISSTVFFALLVALHLRHSSLSDTEQRRHKFTRASSEMIGDMETEKMHVQLMEEFEQEVESEDLQGEEIEEEEEGREEEEEGKSEGREEKANTTERKRNVKESFYGSDSKFWKITAATATGVCLLPSWMMTAWIGQWWVIGDILSALLLISWTLCWGQGLFLLPQNYQRVDSLRNALSAERKKNTQMKAVLREKAHLLAAVTSRMQLCSNTVLQSVHTLLETELTSEQVSRVAAIREASISSLDTCNDAARILQLESPSKEATAFNLRVFLEELLDTAAHMNYTHLDLVYQLRAGVPEVCSGNSAALRQVLLQLLSNAITYSSHGDVRIVVEEANTDPWEKEGPSSIWLCFTVTDSGPGMSKQALASLFDLQHSAPASSKSRSGLGLLLCKKLVVSALGGELKIRSEEGQGTTVTFTGKFSKSDQKIQIEENQDKDQCWGSSFLKDRAILIVDDNEAASNYLSQLLREYGCTVQTAPDGVQGLRELKLSIATRSRFDLLILDYHLRSEDGLEVAATIQSDAAFEHLPIFLLIHPSDRILFSSLPRSIRRCLIKPIKRRQLLEAVHEVVQSPPQHDRGEGSSDTLSFPTERWTATSSGSTAFPLKILLADEDRLALETLQGLVEGLGHSPCTVKKSSHDKNLSLKVVEQCKMSRYDAVFLDSALVPLGAIETAKLIRGHEIPSAYRTTIVVFSSDPSDKERHQCLEAGVDKYLAKPINKLVLGALLEELISQRELSTSLGPSREIIHEKGDAKSTALSTLVPSGPATAKASIMNNYRLAQMEKILGAFIPREYQDLIAPGGVESVELGDAVCKSITIMFSDIRNFTSITERMYVNQVMEFLNTYLAFALPAIVDEGGFVDKFIGDAIMAIFAQQDGQQQAVAAVRAAVTMLLALDFRNDTGFQIVETGIGINTGKAIMGVVGTETRMEPTVLGDAVNLASRTESLCKQYGARILITEHTKEAMKEVGEEEFTIRFVDNVTVKGKSSSCKIYEVLNGDREDVRQAKEKILPLYNSGLALFERGDISGALAAFTECTNLCPTDIPSQLYFCRCRNKLERT